MEVRKEVIRTGKHVYIGHDGRPAVLDTTKDKIDHYFNSGNAMLAAGIPIPVPLEHQPTATPMNAMDRAAHLVRHNVGETKRYERDTIKDPTTGEDIHRVLSVLDIKDPQIAGKVKDGSVRWCSPWISSFVDGAGKAWNEVISHIALTTRPRIHAQQAFENIGAALSVVGQVKDPPKDGFFLLREGLLKQDGQPAYPIAFSMMTGVNLSGTAHDPANGQFTGEGGVKGRKKKKKKITPEQMLANEKALEDHDSKTSHWEREQSSGDYERAKKSIDDQKAHHANLHPYVKEAMETRKKSGRGGTFSVLMSHDDELADDEEWDDDEMDADVNAEMSDAPDVDADPMPGAMKDDASIPDAAAGDVTFEELIPHLLEMHGIHVPAGGKGKEFLQSLVQGLLASAKEKSAQLEPDKVLDDPNKPGAGAPPGAPAGGPIKQESPPMYMSLNAIAKIKDPEKRQMAGMLFSLHQKAMIEAKSGRDRRLAKVCGMVSPKTRDRLLHQAAQPGAALSLGTDGAVLDPLAATLEMLEEEMNNLPDMLRPGGAKLSEQEHPTEDGYLTPSQAEDLANRQTARLAKQSA